MPEPTDVPCCLQTTEATPETRRGGVTVRLEPAGETRWFPSLNTVLQLLNRLNLRPGQALVIRDGGLLTQDRRLNHGDEILVRVVLSSG